MPIGDCGICDCELRLWATMAATEAEPPRRSAVPYEEGWASLKESVDKLVRIVEGSDEQIASEEYMRCFTIVYEICKSQNIDDCQRLYDQYKKILEDYLSAKVLPALQVKQEETLLQELGMRWSKHKFMSNWLCNFFRYLDRYFTKVQKLPSLEVTSFVCFHDVIYGQINHQVRDAIMSMINREREGEKIDQALVKNVVKIYVEMAKGSLSYYRSDFEEAMLKDTATTYSLKASEWIDVCSYEEYMSKTKDCLRHERETVSSYLQSRTPKKLIEIAQRELLSAVHTTKLEAKKHSFVYDETSSRDDSHEPMRADALVSSTTCSRD